MIQHWNFSISACGVCGTDVQQKLHSWDWMLPPLPSFSLPLPLGLKQKKEPEDTVTLPHWVEKLESHLGLAGRILEGVVDSS